MNDEYMTDKQFDAMLLDSIFDLIDIRDHTKDNDTKIQANEKIKRLEVKLRCEHKTYALDM